jgi:hypothetical protein
MRSELWPSAAKLHLDARSAAAVRSDAKRTINLMPHFKTWR